jgi:hypothetical protein
LASAFPFQYLGRDRTTCCGGPQSGWSPDHCGDEQGEIGCLTLLWRCMDYGTPSGWARCPSNEVTDSLGGRSTQRRVEITHDQGAAWRSLSKWISMARPLGLRVPLTVGLCYRPAICPGHLIMMPLNAESRCGSQWGALVPVGC